MYEIIKEIIDRFGGRLGGSKEEDAAQDYYKKKLSTFCNKTIKQEFYSPIGAWFTLLKIIPLLYFFNILLIFISIPLGTIFSFITCILFLSAYVHKKWLFTFFPLKRSSNVIGVLDPKGETKSTIILSGHIDSSREFILWYKLKSMGFAFNLLSAFLIVSIPFLFMFLHIRYAHLSDLSSLHRFIFLFYIILSPTIFSWTFIHGKRVVPGAMDNLSGISTAFGIGKKLAERKGRSLLKNTQIKIISFGSEEQGVFGSEAYTRKYKDALGRKKTLMINLEAIQDIRSLKLISSELMYGVRYPPQLLALVEKAFQKHNIKIKKGQLLAGGTDAKSFDEVNVPAVSIVGMPILKLSPYYHTRLDTPEAIDKEVLYAVRNVFVDFIKKWDKDLSEKYNDKD